jgi:hypothetical protein
VQRQNELLLCDFNNLYLRFNLGTVIPDSNPVLDRDTDFTHEELLGVLYQLRLVKILLSGFNILLVCTKV